ncbi:LLM class flavin-dependent oxidoreductase [Allostreptomyces psammosilenae]|uniref:Luciferase family oxidoreductase group 1 n=1 Tax=Allostreptomyces psammosilenae TaxID=1892865 RepID=A0A853A0F8_9ACTN|nr:LLM class flavin-dependent oxidoreductase [Allostreptomyces psammosilenae]NYI07607.1 luciferase family oxidoreductase group 1 [Allostreptomyces psammosilenae]
MTDVDLVGGRRIAWSVLDTAPVWRDSSPTEALRESVALARAVEPLGCTRYWVAEHHSAPFIASCAPPVLVAQIVNATRRMRVGSGGVMLPNHPPLVVAEQFGTLEALHPGRVDLGVGRSPGTDLATAAALRRVSAPPESAVFAAQVEELIGYFAPATPATGSPTTGDGATGTPATGDDGTPTGGDGHRPAITAVPAQGNRPQIWLLGASVANARFAGALGLPFAFAYHVRPEMVVPALDAYREAFRPSEHRDRPYTIVAAPVVAADTDDRAAWLAGPVGAIVVDATRGVRDRPNATPEEAARRVYSPVERAIMERHLSTHLIGGPRTLRHGLDALLRTTGADELMAVSLVHGLADRVRSYELLAEALEGAPARLASPGTPVPTR